MGYQGTELMFLKLKQANSPSFSSIFGTRILYAMQDAARECLCELIGASDLG